MVAGNNPISVILLAAGSSSRLGQSKQLVQVDGKTLLEKSAQAALDSEAGHVMVVLGAQATLHKKVIEKLAVEVVINEDWKKGMGNSLKAGLQHLISNYPKTEAVIITVCDQPFLTSEHLNKLIATYQKTKTEIVASSYNQTKGVPALFSRYLFGQLLELEEMAGARKIILNYPTDFPLVEFPRGEIDLDTPEDLARLTNKDS
jgi:molybdenum cofactor cytidylyltransferase